MEKGNFFKLKQSTVKFNNPFQRAHVKNIYNKKFSCQTFYINFSNTQKIRN